MAKIVIPAQWFANVVRYMDQLQSDTTDAADHAVGYIHEKVVEKARDDPDWASLADDITVWSQDGMYYVGVNNEDMVSEAMALEYGDETRPPTALFRTISEDVREANKRWREEMESKGYTYGMGIKR